MLSTTSFFRTTILAVSLILVLTFVVGCEAGRQPEKQPVVVVSVAPQAYLIERMTGGLVSVKTMIGKGRSPEEFQPLPRQLAALDGAKYYFAVGLPFERIWLTRLSEIQPETEIIAVDFGEDTNDLDPHYWTNPRNAIELVHAAYAPLQKILPDATDQLLRNYRGLVDELEILDARIQTLMAEQTARRFLVYHPAWSHFASHYDLEQIAFERDGKPPGAKYLRDLLALCRLNSVQTVLVQPQSPPDQVRRFADELGASQVMIDPLQYNYTENLWAVAQIISRELW